ncbi:MAG: UDP-N-acetylmuramoyl-L-alanine--D-glutamate ligase [Candidatus Gastranaerophilales bacterium]|nr:UDP-N-acetylmuramoyl-L-alanine--D-glutamate ligase [Candidatus Gastranaerophilales bacterium]
MELKNKNILILGLSISGISVAKYASKEGANVVISESRQQKPEDTEKIQELNNLNIKVEMGFHSDNAIKNADIIVTSPSIPPEAEIFQRAKCYNKEVISEPDFAYLNKSEKSKFITITGTNGKTTTTKLTSEILCNAGFKAPFCGNIGVPPTDLLDEDVDYFVMEISSYQIYHSKYLKPHIGAFINYTPDHVTWHGSKEEYLRVKQSHFIGENAPEYAVLNFKDEHVKELENKTPSKIVAFDDEFSDFCIFEKADKLFLNKNKDMEKVCDLSSAKIFGKHNHQNMMCAVSIAKILDINNDVIQKTIDEFKAPAHRIEYIAEIDGIKYYNDSKGTNCDSSICALKAFKDKVVLIAGGRDKMTDLTEFAQTIDQKATNVVLIGEATERFAKALEEIGYKNIIKTTTLESAIDIAGNLNQGDVLFSPACASFDMFKNFEERGDVFRNHVLSKIR